MLTVRTPLKTLCGICRSVQFHRIILTTKQRNLMRLTDTVISLYTVPGMDFLEPLKLLMKIHCFLFIDLRKEQERKKSVTQSLWQNF